MDYRLTPLPEQFQIMSAELENRASLQTRAAMWEATLATLGRSLGSVTGANRQIDGYWADRVGTDFMADARGVELTMTDWHDRIGGSAPHQRLTELAGSILDTYAEVKAAYDEMVALQGQMDGWRAALDTTGYQPYGGGGGVATSLNLTNQITTALARIEELQIAGGTAMNELAGVYRGTGTALMSAVSGRPFEPPVGGALGATYAGGPAAGAAGATAGAGGPAGATAGGTGAVGPDAGAAGAGGPAAAGGPALSGEPAAAGAAGGPGGAGGPVSAGGGAPPGGAGAAGGESPNLSGLGQAAQPSLSGGAATAPSPTLPTTPSFPGSPGGPGVPGTPTVPGGTPYVPPVLPPGLGGGNGSGPTGLSPVARGPGGGPSGVRGAGGGIGARVPGVSIGGAGAAGLPQAAVPVEMRPVPTQPSATGVPSIGTTGAPSAGPIGTGGVPPIIPPMMGGFGAGGGSGNTGPGSGAAHRPPGGRGPAVRPTPGLPALLSGKTGKSDKPSFPSRPLRRELPDRPRPTEAPMGLPPVDEDLWRVDGPPARA